MHIDTTVWRIMSNLPIKILDIVLFQSARESFFFLFSFSFFFSYFFLLFLSTLRLPGKKKIKKTRDFFLIFCVPKGGEKKKKKKKKKKIKDKKEEKKKEKKKKKKLKSGCNSLLAETPWCSPQTSVLSFF